MAEVAWARVTHVERICSTTFQGDPKGRLDG